jgi:hypothetical protein
MSKTTWGVSDGGSGYEKPPVGNHTGICTKLIDIGTQTGEYEGNPTERRQCLVEWELPEEERTDGKPFTISKFYTLSRRDDGSIYISEKSNLFKDLTSWFGKPPTDFDPESLLGKGCQVIVTEKKEKHVVNAVTGLPKSVKVGKPSNDVVLFLLSDFNEDTFENLSSGIKKMIMKSPEYAKIVSGGDDEVAETEIPF